MKLVTGATGFIGSHFLDKDTVAIARDINRRVHQHPEVTWCFGDLADPRFVERVVLDYRPDVVLHLGAKAVVLTAEKSTYDTYKSNVLGTVNLLDACEKLDRKPLFLQMSTDKVVPYENAKETDPYGSKLGHYARTKMMQEVALAERIEIPSVIVRSCNVIGPGDTHSRIVPNSIRECIEKKCATIFVEKPPSKRHYIDIDDVVESVNFLVNRGAQGIYHIGGPAVRTQEEVVREVLSHFPDAKPVYVEREHTGKEIITQSLNFDKLRAIGWEPKVSFEESIERTVRWWRYGIKDMKFECWV